MCKEIKAATKATVSYLFCSFKGNGCLFPLFPHELKRINGVELLLICYSYQPIDYPSGKHNKERIKHAWTWRLPLQGISNDTKIHAISVYLIGSLVSWCWAQPNAGMNLPPGFHQNFHSRKWAIPWHANWVLLLFFNWDIVDIFNSFRVYNVMIHNVCIYC